MMQLNFLLSDKLMQYIRKKKLTSNSSSSLCNFCTSFDLHFINTIIII